MELSTYKLADIALLETCRARASSGDYEPLGEWQRLAFVPEEHMVVLGASNSIDKSVKVDACEKDKLSVIKRHSGGEAVVVSPNTLCYASCFLAKKLPRSADFFSDNLEYISHTLSDFGVRGIERRGISDLSINEDKFLGSAIYRTTNLIFFQAVINLAEPGELIGRYLLQPSRMPDYRANRPHESFVRSLLQQGYALDAKLLKERLENAYK